MLLFKPGVDLNNLKPQAAAAMTVAAGVFDFYRSHCMVTSVGDSKHGIDSLHYKGLAFDCRLASRYNSTLQGVDAAVVAKLKESLTAQYDVVLEGEDTPGASGAHIHIEYDPLHDGKPVIV
jgi:hypothetical protein